MALAYVTKLRLRHFVDAAPHVGRRVGGSISAGRVGPIGWQQPIMVADALNAIHGAIAQGVPLFNRGDALGCLETYQTCAASLVSAPQVPQGVANRLQQGLAASARGGDPADRAWTMRHALDDVILMLRGGGAESSAGGASPVVISFADRSLRWSTVDDRVMGGSSQSHMAVDPTGGGAVFEGELVTAGGGFASVRCVPNRPMPALKGARAVVLRCEGDGRPGYKLTLKTDGSMDGVTYQAGFEAPPRVSGAPGTFPAALAAPPPAAAPTATCPVHTRHSPP